MGLRTLSFTTTAVVLSFGVAACTTTLTSPPGPPVTNADAAASEPPPDTAPPACALATMPSGAGKANFGDDSAGGSAWVVRMASGTTALSVEGYESAGGPTKAASGTLRAADMGYDTCALCVVYQTGCSTKGGATKCTKTFMPDEGGAFALTALEMKNDGRVMGSLSAITLREVKISDSSGKTTLVQGGESLCLGEFTFRGTLTEISDV